MIEINEDKRMNKQSFQLAELWEFGLKTYFTEIDSYWIKD